MRTTVRLNEALMGDAKRHALETGRSLTELLRDAVVGLLERERGASSPRTVSLPVYGGEGFVAPIDPDDGSAVRDRMDGVR